MPHDGPRRQLSLEGTPARVSAQPLGTDYTQTPQVFSDWRTSLASPPPPSVRAAGAAGLEVLKLTDYISRALVAPSRDRAAPPPGLGGASAALNTTAASPSATRASSHVHGTDWGRLELAPQVLQNLPGTAAMATPPGSTGPGRGSAGQPGPALSPPKASPARCHRRGRLPPGGFPQTPGPGRAGRSCLRSRCTCSPPPLTSPSSPATSCSAGSSATT